MKSRIRFAAIALSVALCSSGSAQTQSRPQLASPRQYDGWTAAPPAGASSSANPPSSTRTANSPQLNLPNASTQHAFYQSQGRLSDGLPVLPAGAYDSPGSHAGLPQLPTPPLPNYAPGLSNSQLALPAGLPAALPPNRPEAQVMPPSSGLNASPLSYSSPANTAEPRQRPLPAQQVGFPQNASNSAAQPNNELRRIQESAQAIPGRLNSQEIATGLPYVTPSPRTGRYPTSPYIGPRYQNAAYQLRTIPAQTVAAQIGGGLSVPDAAAAAAQQPVLPQYQNAVGIYPTAYQQCAPNASFHAAGAVPGAYTPPTLPPNLTPSLYSANNSGYSPLFSLGQENYNVLLGRGIIGQPTVYVPGQPFRNFFRYISP